MSLVWINGQLIDKAEARVSPFDHGFLYGDGVWEHLRIFGGKPFRPADVLSWLYTAAYNLGIDIPLTQDEMTAAIEATVCANNRTEGYIRVIVTRGPGTIGPDPRKLDPQVIIIAEEYQPFPAELYEHGLHVVISEPGIWSYGRPPIFRTLCQRHIIKGKQDALARGCLEAVLIDDLGYVYGCTEGHLFRLLDGVIRQVTYYPGDITAHYVVKDLASMIPVPFATKIEEIDRGPTSDHLWDAEEVFLAGTSCGVIGIVQIDGRPIGSGTEGPITRQIRLAYRQLARGE